MDENEEQGFTPEENAVDWPPPLANRATRRHCLHRIKGGYCVLCGQTAIDG